MVGQGVRALVDGEDVLIGSRSFMEENHIPFSNVSDPDTVQLLDDKLKQLEQDGKTVILFAIGNDLAGYMAIADQIKVC